MDLSRFPRRRYTLTATPIEPLPRFSAALAASCRGGRGPEVWIKRDDLLGLSPGGNKTRKLEFLVADALAQGADTLITCGAPQSNHCRITLAAAVKEGLKCRFVIEERVPDSYRDDASGNHFLFRLYGVEAITVVPAGSRHGGGDAAAGRGAARARAQGLRHPRRRLQRARRPGLRRLCAGVAAAMLRPRRAASTAWSSARAARARTAACSPVSSATASPRRSSASASAATRRSRCRWCIRRRRPCASCSVWTCRCRQTRCAASAATGSRSTRCRTRAWSRRCRLLARSEGILLDPVYTGKVMAGLIGLARAGELRAGERVLFLHTGGMPSLFAYQPELLGQRELPP